MPDDTRRPCTRWVGGGTTNLCHTASDRHLATQADKPALIFVSSETGEERIFSFAELHREVQRMAAILGSLGVGPGDRVLIYLPYIPQAVFALYACPPTLALLIAARSRVTTEPSVTSPSIPFPPARCDATLGSTP